MNNKKNPHRIPLKQKATFLACCKNRTMGWQTLCYIGQRRLSTTILSRSNVSPLVKLEAWGPVVKLNLSQVVEPLVLTVWDFPEKLKEIASNNT